MNEWVDGWMKRSGARGRTIRHLLEGFFGGMAGRERSVATVHVDLVANCSAASGTRLERLREWLALGSKLHVNMVVSTM